MTTHEISLHSVNAYWQMGVNSESDGQSSVVNFDKKHVKSIGSIGGKSSTFMSSYVVNSETLISSAAVSDISKNTTYFFSEIQIASHTITSNHTTDGLIKFHVQQNI